MEDLVKMKARKGFTLIELLVVIAIIAILAAILFPVFIKAKQKAQQAACLSNVKQLTLSIIMYRDDYTGTFPPRTFTERKAGTWDALPELGTRTHRAWYVSIYPYTKNKDMIACPAAGVSPKFGRDGWYAGGAWISDAVHVNGNGTPSEDLSGTPWYDAVSGPLANKTPDKIDYYYNQFVGQPSLGFSGLLNVNVSTVTNANGDDVTDQYGADFYSPINEAQIIDVSNKFLVWDSNFPNQQMNALGGFKCGNMSVTGRHNGGVNMGYCDGHAGFVNAMTIVQGVMATPAYNPDDPSNLHANKGTPSYGGWVGYSHGPAFPGSVFDAYLKDPAHNTMLTIDTRFQPTVANQ